MTTRDSAAHDRAIHDQFTRQAAGFAAGPELHADDIVALVAEAANAGPNDDAIDLACGPGSVACALATTARRVIGVDATPAMLLQARLLAARQSLSNLEWHEGNVYAVPFADRSFAAVTCRFAFHHLDDPPRAFAEMIRLTAPGGRIVLCDGVAPSDPGRGAAFNAMERWRDPSTVEFRTLDYLRRLFTEHGLGEPRVKQFQVTYSATDLVRRSFPANDDRDGLLALIERSVSDDRLGMSARRSEAGVLVSYHSAVLSVVRQ